MTDPHSLAAGYALDALDHEEEREFELHLVECERCREELATLRDAAAGLAFAAARTPPPELRQRILEQARAERPNVVSLPHRRPWTRPLPAIAAVAAVAAVALGVWGATRTTRSDAFAQVLAKPGAKIVSMGDRGAVAVAPDGSAALALTAPHAPTGKTYEAWVIKHGKAARAGLLAGASTIRLQRPVGRGAVVAVTLERAGGVDQPTQKPLAATKEIS